MSAKPSFKVGDEVFVVYDNGFSDDRKSFHLLTTVASISAKRGDIKVKDFASIFDSTGHQKTRTDRWHRGPWLELATPELKAYVKAKVARSRALNYVKDFDFKKLKDDVLFRVEELLKSWETKDEA